MPDFMQIGGVTGWRRAAAIAAAAGIPISTHLHPEVAAHVMRVTETAHWIEWQAWANPILRRPNEVKDGTLGASSPSQTFSLLFAMTSRGGMATVYSVSPSTR
jgi:L-alanine-DL-glutamate epimerase-like enolase superfamily enzyme